jgi:hypothetical protein
MVFLPTLKSLRSFFEETTELLQEKVYWVVLSKAHLSWGQIQIPISSASIYIKVKIVTHIRYPFDTHLGTQEGIYSVYLCVCTLPRLLYTQWATRDNISLMFLRVVVSSSSGYALAMSSKRGRRKTCGHIGVLQELQEEHEKMWWCHPSWQTISVNH